MKFENFASIYDFLGLILIQIVLDYYYYYYYYFDLYGELFVSFVKNGGISRNACKAFIILVLSITESKGSLSPPICKGRFVI